MGVADLRSILSGLSNDVRSGNSNSGNGNDNIDLSSNGLQKIIIHYTDYNNNQNGVPKTIEVTTFPSESIDTLLGNVNLEYEEFVYSKFKVIPMNGMVVLKTDDKYYYLIQWEEETRHQSNSKAGGTYDVFWDFYLHESPELLTRDTLLNLLLSNLLDGKIYRVFAYQYTEGA